MPQFNEANSVRDFIRDLMKSPDVQFIPGIQLPRGTDEALLEGPVKAALARLNPEIQADSAKADEVVYRLRAILISARAQPQPVDDLYRGHVQVGPAGEAVRSGVVVQRLSARCW
jgi:type I restriction enzyme, R subunit